MKLKGDVLPSITPQIYNIFVAMSRKNRKRSVHPLISEKRKVKNEKFFTFNYSLFTIHYSPTYPAVGTRWLYFSLLKEGKESFLYKNGEVAGDDE